MRKYEILWVFRIIHIHLNELSIEFNLVILCDLNSSKMKKIAVLTGAGISAESGISTFRDANGLWENHPIEEVASIEAWQKNPELVLDFYNKRRNQLKKVQPNSAHFYLKELEQKYEVHIITQNVDDLHERAGSSRIIHLHGELVKVRSEKNEDLIYDWTDNLYLGDKAEDGAQLRPHIVWFGEEVPLLEKAVKIVESADYLLIIGTSLLVYPAASLIHYTKFDNPIYLINPDKNLSIPKLSNLHLIQEPATIGISHLPF
jgi:NAD-dependent deacetylase